MKKGIIAFFILNLIFACTKEDDGTEKPTNFFEYYQLVKMTGSFNGSETTGSDMEWQETYILNSKDSTFIKSRLVNKVTFEASGIYTYITIDNQEYIELTFNEDSIVIGNCFGDLIETLQILEDGNKLVSTWSACDGPRLEYQKAVEFCGTES